MNPKFYLMKTSMLLFKGKILIDYCLCRTKMQQQKLLQNQGQDSAINREITNAKSAHSGEVSKRTT